MSEEKTKKLEWSDYDWQDWTEHWGISLEQTKINWEKAKEEDRPDYVAANEIIQKQVAKKREEEQAQKLAKEKYKAQQLTRQKEKQEKLQKALASLPSSRSAQPKDASADQRADYSRQISQKEEGLDQLRDFEKNYQVSNDRFMVDAKRCFEKSQELTDQRRQYSSQESERQNQLLEEVYRQLKSVTDGKNEALEGACRQARYSLEDDIENLYKERASLPW